MISQKLRSIGNALTTTREEPITVEFGIFAPDLPDLGNPGNIEALNVYPNQRSYSPVKSLAAQTNALESQVLGATVARDSTNTIYTYAGTGTKLYELIGDTFTDESKGGGYSTASGEVWEFAVWDASQKIIATNFSDDVQSMDIGGGASTAFADMIVSTEKPKARHIAVVRDFVVLGNINSNSDGLVPNRVHWSALRDETDFDPSLTTQSDFADLDEGGWVQKLVGGAEYGVIFQETQIRRLQKVTSPIIFDPVPVDRQRGTTIPGSVVSRGRLIAFIADDGFHIFDGSQSVPIGEDLVDNFFNNQFDINNKENVSAAVDPINKLFVWAFPGAGAGDGLPNKLLFYEWANRRWSHADLDTDLIVRSTTGGRTLDGLDSVSTNLDLLPESLDSDRWKGGQLVLQAFDRDHKLANFAGSNLAATLDTKEVQLRPNRRSMVTGVRPLVDGGAVSAAIGSRQSQQDSVDFSAIRNVNGIGEANIRKSGRYHRFRVQIGAGGNWTHAQGVEVLSSGRGDR